MIAERPSVFHALGETVARGTELIQLELRVARAELAEKATVMKGGLALVAAGGMIATVALFVVAQAVVAGLIEAGLTPFAAAAIVAVVLAAIAAVLIATGRKQLDPATLVPQRTIDDVARDGAVIKEKLS